MLSTQRPILPTLEQRQDYFHCPERHWYCCGWQQTGSTVWRMLFRSLRTKSGDVVSEYDRGIVIKLETSAVRSRISSQLIFARCMRYSAISIADSGSNRLVFYPSYGILLTLVLVMYGSSDHPCRMSCLALAHCASVCLVTVHCNCCY